MPECTIINSLKMNGYRVNCLFKQLCFKRDLCRKCRIEEKFFFINLVNVAIQLVANNYKIKKSGSENRANVR